MARNWQVLTARHELWHKVWYIPNFMFLASYRYITMDRSGWFYITIARSVHMANNIGPFDTFEAAAACFEVVANN